MADRDYATLRAHAGTAPVTKRSGKRVFFVHMRYACKRRLRQALYHWARTSIQHDAAARAYYDALRARGHSHARALRSVADRWLRILVAMLTTGNAVRRLTTHSSGGCDRLTNGGKSTRRGTERSERMRCERFPGARSGAWGRAPPPQHSL